MRLKLLQRVRKHLMPKRLMRKRPRKRIWVVPRKAPKMMMMVVAVEMKMEMRL